MSVEEKFKDYINRWMPSFENGIEELTRIIDQELQELEQRIMERIGARSTVTCRLCKRTRNINDTYFMYGYYYCEKCDPVQLIN